MAAQTQSFDLGVDCSAPRHGNVSYVVGQVPGLPACVLVGQTVLGRWLNFQSMSPIESFHYTQYRTDLSNWPTRGVLPDNATFTDVGLLNELFFAPSGVGLYELEVQACNEMGFCSQPLRSANQLIVLSKAVLPPVSGVGSASLCTDYRGLLTKGTFCGRWPDFSDPNLPNGPPIQYDICVGTTPWGCQIVPRRVVDQRSSAQKPLIVNGDLVPGVVEHEWHDSSASLRCDSTHYLTVRATNCAGLHTAIVSEGVRYCCSPPSIGAVQLLTADNETLTFAGKAGVVVVSWDGATDGCSGLKELAVSLSSNITGAVIWQSGVLPVDATSIRIPSATLENLVSETGYVVTVSATSHALLTTMVTKALRVDKTPQIVTQPQIAWPKSPLKDKLKAAGGSARQLMDSDKLCLPHDVEYVDVYWGGGGTAFDLERRNYAITSFSVPVSDLANSKSLVWTPLEGLNEAEFPASELNFPGQTYFAVRVCHPARGCDYSPWSGGVSLVLPPAGGQVAALLNTDGGGTSGDGGYLLNRMGIKGEWSSFTSSGCPEICGPAQQTCMYDASCTAFADGCNANGVGAHCRYCGFGSYPPCVDVPKPPVGADLDYEICIGTTPYGCQVVPFQRVGNGTAVGAGRWENVTAEMVCGETHFMTVRATNCAGLQRAAVSKGTKLCCTPPEKGTMQLFTDGGDELAQKAFVGAATGAIAVYWLNFEDACAGLREIGVTVVETSSGAVVWDSGRLDASETSVSIPWQGLAGLVDGARYEVDVGATSNAGLTTNISKSFTVDLGAPAASSLLLALRAELDESLLADAPSATICAPHESELILSWGGMADNVSGIANFTVDFEPPIRWDGNGRGSRWQVSSALSANATDNADADEAGKGTTVGASGVLYYGASTTSGVGVDTALSELAAGLTPTPLVNSFVTSDTLVQLPVSALAPVNQSFRVRACDHVGLCTDARPGRALRVVSEPPSGGAVQLQDAVGAELLVPIFCNPETGLSAIWDGFVSGVAGADSLVHEVCVGTSPTGCQVHAFKRMASPYVVPMSLLECGKTYHITARATNCGGLQGTAASTAVRLCCEPPVAGIVQLFDLAGRPASYVGSVGDLVAAWSGFYDLCGGLQSYEVRVGRAAALAGSLNITWAYANMSAATPGIVLPAAMLSALVDGGKYEVTVIATGYSGLTSSATTPFSVDLSPPVAGTVYGGARPRSASACQAVSEPLRISWTGFQDAQSGLRSIEWALGTSENGTDLKPYESLHPDLDGSEVLEWHDTPALLAAQAEGRTVFASLRVTNNAGDVTTGHSTGLSLSAGNCRAPVQCYPPGSSTAGVHPLFAALVMSQLPEKLYTVETEADLPSRGRVRTVLNVRLKELMRRPSGSRFMRLDVDDDGYILDQYGMQDSDSFHRRLPLHAHPFFYNVANDGTVSSMLYHPEDTGEILGNKKLLVSYIQVKYPRGRRRQLASSRNGAEKDEAWTMHERDVHGAAAVQYSSHMDEVGRRVVHKEQHWRAPLGGDSDFIQAKGAATIVLDERTESVLQVQSEYTMGKMADLVDDTVNQRYQSIDGFEMMPTEPTQTSWTLVETPSPPPPSHSRRRSLEARRDDVSLDTLTLRLGFLRTSLDHPMEDEVKRVGGDYASLERKFRKRGKEDDELDCHGDAYEQMEQVPPLAHPCPSAVPDSQLLLTCSSNLPCLPIPLLIFGDNVTEQAILCALYQHGDAFHDISKDEGLKCVSRLEELSRVCPELPIRASVENVVHERCNGDAALDCGGLVNALGMLNAQKELTTFVSSHCVRHMPDALRVMLIDVQPPSGALLEAVAKKLDVGAHVRHWVDNATADAAARAYNESNCHEFESEDLHDEVEFHDEQAWLNLLLASSAAAGLGAKPKPGSEALVGWRDAVAHIHHHVLGFLDAMSSYDNQTFAKEHALAFQRAEDMWERELGDHEQELFVTEHSHLNRRALGWAIENGHHQAHVETAKQHLHDEIYLRQTKGLGERLHLARLRTALRAVRNLRPADQKHALRVAAFLNHRDEGVVEDAVTALRAFEGRHEGSHAEARLLEHVAKHAHPAKSYKCREAPKKLLHALKALSHWQHIERGTGNATLSEAVRLLLRMERSFVFRVLYDKDHRPHIADKQCVIACVGTCNPHGNRRDCKHHCQNACLSGADVVEELAKLVRRALVASRLPDDQVPEWLKLHLWEHGPSAHPSWHAPEEAVEGGAGKDGWHVFEPASFAPFVDRTDAAAVERERAAEASRRRRRLFDWKSIDFNKFSLTFINLKILMAPNLNLNKFWGMDLPSPMGKVGCAVYAGAHNTAWLRVGLFGGGFGIFLNNQFTASAVRAAAPAQCSPARVCASCRSKRLSMSLTLATPSMGSRLRRFWGRPRWIFSTSRLCTSLMPPTLLTS